VLQARYQRAKHIDAVELNPQMVGIVRDHYAQLTGRTKSYVAMEALSEYLDWRVPQIEDLKAAVAAADAGDFADAQDVEGVLSRYEKPAAPRAAARPGRPARKA